MADYGSQLVFARDAAKRLLRALSLACKAAPKGDIEIVAKCREDAEVVSRALEQLAAEHDDGECDW